jgi:glycosyltransferase involved in cell wall biosynthesis
MIKAVELARQPATLALAGNFLDPGLEEASRRMPGWPRVRHGGFMWRSDLGRLMGKAVAGLVVFQPDKAHMLAQPNKLFEYMSASLPVIASDFPLWRRIVSEAGCGLLVNPRDPLAIAEAMNRIMDDPGWAMAMGRQGRLAVENSRHWGAVFPRVTELYDRLALERPERRR